MKNSVIQNNIFQLKDGEHLFSTDLEEAALINYNLKNNSIERININGYRICALEKEPKIVTFAYKLNNFFTNLFN